MEFLGYAFFYLVKAKHKVVGLPNPWEPTFGSSQEIGPRDNGHALFLWELRNPWAIEQTPYSGSSI